jgi:hypothetical protein
MTLAWQQCRSDPRHKIDLTILRCSITLTFIVSKGSLISELARVALVMASGSLSEVTRQCGDPSCACAWDPSRRHGPHLYLKFNAEGKAHSVYIPAEEQEAIRQAHQAWLRFNEIATRIAASNRQRLLQALDEHKQATKAGRAKARARA